MTVGGLQLSGRAWSRNFSGGGVVQFVSTNAVVKEPLYPPKSLGFASIYWPWQGTRDPCTLGVLDLTTPFNNARYQTCM